MKLLIYDIVALNMTTRHGLRCHAGGMIHKSLMTRHDPMAINMLNSRFIKMTRHDTRLDKYPYNNSLKKKDGL